MVPREGRESSPGVPLFPSPALHPREASLRLPGAVEGGAVRLRAEIETRGVRRPVRWACAQPLAADGALEVRLLAADDPRWRKGI